MNWKLIKNLSLITISATIFFSGSANSTNVHEVFVTKNEASMEKAIKAGYAHASFRCTKHALQPDWQTFTILETQTLREKRLAPNGKRWWKPYYQVTASVECIK